MSEWPELKCYHHPEADATSQCDRCGDYLCSECVGEHSGDYLCQSCFGDATDPMDSAGVTRAISAVGVLSVLLPLLFLSIAYFDVRILWPTLLMAMLLLLLGLSAYLYFAVTPRRVLLSSLLLANVASVLWLTTTNSVAFYHNVHCERALVLTAVFAIVLAVAANVREERKPLHRLLALLSASAWVLNAGIVHFSVFEALNPQFGAIVASI